MSNTKELKQRFESIHDMRSIVTAMKTLAFMETKKLNRYLADQGRAASSLRAAAADLLAFYPMLQAAGKWSRTLLIAVGADRGFCGNFNEEIVDAVRKQIELHGADQPAIVAVGDRLSSKLQHLRLTHTVAGATFAEEVPTVLASVAQLVSSQIEMSRPELVRVKLIAHEYGKEVKVIEPLAELESSTARYGTRPQLTLDPAKFFSLLLDQYFRFVLYHLFYSSLMAENTKRIMHLDSALRRLDDDYDQFRRQYHRARQEEITEEIEVLIMNITERLLKD